MAEAFGLAVGNVLLIRIGLVVFIMGALFLSRQFSNYASLPQTYTTFEKNKLLNFLAFQLLLARDEKYVTSSNTKAIDSIVSNLSKELEGLPVVNRFFEDNEDTRVESEVELQDTKNKILRAEKSSELNILKLNSSDIAESVHYTVSTTVFKEEIENPMKVKRLRKSNKKDRI